MLKFSLAVVGWMAAVVALSCGHTEEVLLHEDTDLIVALGGAEYVNSTASEKYEAAEYLMRKGRMDNARAIYEDILTYDPRVVGIKYKLAMIYLKMDVVHFARRNAKGKKEYFEKNGKELGEAVLHEILDRDPWFLPVYSQLMILEADKKNLAEVKQLYEKAKALEDDFATSDYRVGFITLSNESNSSRFEEGKAYLQKGQKTYRDLYTSYKNLGGIQRVQHQDTLAIASFLKALENKSEAVDLFNVYYELANLNDSLYKEHKDAGSKQLALQYACASLQYFPGYTPSMKIIQKLANVGADSAGGGQTAVNDYCKTIIQAKDQIKVSDSTDSVIPKSLLLEELKSKQSGSTHRKGSMTPLYVGGGILVGAGGVVFLLSTVAGGKSSTSSFGAPPGFPPP